MSGYLTADEGLTADESGLPLTPDLPPAPAPAPFTQEDVNRLKRAIVAAGNVGSVTYSDGKQVRYLPIAEAAGLLALMEKDVRATVAADAPPAARGVRAFRASYRSGY